MRISVAPSRPEGKIKAIASKSVAHRLLICAAFADGDTKIRCDETNRDIEATAGCLTALGAKIVRDAPYYYVSPIKSINKNATLNCHESGSTMRFILPVAAALGADASFLMAGRLPQRPLSPLREELEAHGMVFSETGSNPLTSKGSLSGDSFEIAGNVSSQFISGLLFALTLLGRDTTLTVTGKIESAPYIDITADALRLFSAEPEKRGNVYYVKAKKLISPREIDVEGDWSNAAFPLAAGAIGGASVAVSGLDPRSSQGDRAVIDILRRFGARVTENEDGYTVSGDKLCGIDIDATQIPDLVPILATIAAVADGTTKIYGAARLRIKESDRLSATTDMLCRLGADVKELPDGLLINGVSRLKGGSVSSFNDHRIAMSAAIASAVCDGEIIIDGAEAMNKSYPSFLEDIKNIKIFASIK